MKKIFKCINDYIDDLENQIMSIVNDQKIPLAEKNRLMKPIADQKEILNLALAKLEDIKEKEYHAGCGMSRYKK